MQITIHKSKTNNNEFNTTNTYALIYSKLLKLVLNVISSCCNDNNSRVYNSRIPKLHKYFRKLLRK